jgi:hypothetical protein
MRALISAFLVGAACSSSPAAVVTSTVAERVGHVDGADSGTAPLFGSAIAALPDDRGGVLVAWRSCAPAAV